MSTYPPQPPYGSGSQDGNQPSQPVPTHSQPSAPQFGSPHEAPQGTPAYDPQGNAPAHNPQGAPAYDPQGYAPKPDVSSVISGSLGWMWKALTNNIAVFLVPALVYSIVSAVLIFVAYFVGIALMVTSAESDMYGQPSNAATLTFLALTLGAVVIVVVAVAMWMSGVYRAAGMLSNGEKPRLKHAFLGSFRVILTYLVVTILIAIGTMLFVIPGIIAGFLLVFAPSLAAKGYGLGEALKASVKTATENIVPTLVLVIVLSVITGILSFTIIGSILYAPVIALTYVAANEILNRRPLAQV